MIIRLLVLLALFGIATSRGVSQGTNCRVDQQHDWPNETEAYHSIQALAPVVQEFTPALSALDVVEIWTQDLGFSAGNGVGATLEVWLRQDTTNGPVLAISAPLVLPDGWNALSRFNFTNLVWLTPQTRYALELRVLAGDNWGVNSHGNLFPPAYSRGRYFLAGRPVEDIDMWFRTGLRIPAPVVALAKGELRWQGVSPLAYRVWGSVDLKDWAKSAHSRQPAPIAYSPTSS
jgi:hypothetical protein